jgi:hypothetical protein
VGRIAKEAPAYVRRFHLPQERQDFCKSETSSDVARAGAPVFSLHALQLTWRAPRDYKPGATAACAVTNSPGSFEALPKAGDARGPGRSVGGASAGAADLASWS